MISPVASFDSIYQNQRTTIEIENRTSALRHFKDAPRYRTYNHQHYRLEVGFVQEIPSKGDRIAEVHHQVWCSTRDEQGLARQGRDFRLIFAQSFWQIWRRQLMDFINGTQLLLAHVGLPTRTRSHATFSTNAASRLPFLELHIYPSCCRKIGTEFPGLVWFMSCVLIRPTDRGKQNTPPPNVCQQNRMLPRFSVFKVPILDTSPNKGKFVGWLVDITTYSQKLKLNDHFFQV